MTRTNPVAAGDRLGSCTVTLRRGDLVRYAGASGDHNPIHYSDNMARKVDLPGVIAHGMLTMGLAIQIVVDWAGDPAAIRYYQCRFTNIVPVPDDDHGTSLTFAAVVGSVDDEAGTAHVDLTATLGNTKVLGRAYAVVALP